MSAPFRVEVSQRWGVGNAAQSSLGVLRITVQCCNFLPNVNQVIICKCRAFYICTINEIAGFHTVVRFCLAARAADCHGVYAYSTTHV